MAPPRRIVVLWLALAAFTFVAPLLGADGCDESCDVHCGDCVWCPLNAEMVPADTAVAMTHTGFPALSARNESLVPARALDHVPLAS